MVEPEPSLTITMGTSAITTPFVTSMKSTNVSPTSTTGPQKDDDDEDRKVVLGIVLSIVGAIIVGVIMAMVVYFLWKKKRSASYEKIPTM